MRLPPPEVVASWPKPNYTNPDTRGPDLLIVELITLSVALICLALRLYVRVVMMRKMEADDWLMCGAAFFGTGVTTCVVLAVLRYGWDMHVWDLTFDKLIDGRQVSFAAQALFVPATSMAKVSILVSYLRLAPRNSLFRRMTWAAIAFVITLNIVFFIVLFTQCIPLESYWDLFKNDRDCVGEAPTLLAQTSTTAIADFIVWAVPIPSIATVKIPRQKRLGLIALFSFGLVVVIAACMRTYWVHYIVQETYDVTWFGVYLWMWTAVEVQLGIICGCVPWLKSLLKFWMANRRVKDLTDKSRKSRSGGGKTTKDSGSKEGSTVVAVDSKSWHEEKGKISKGDAVVRIDSLVSVSHDEGREKETGVDREYFLDLESGTGSDVESIIPEAPSPAYPRPTFVGRTCTPQLLPPDTPGLAL